MRDSVIPQRLSQWAMLILFVHAVVFVLSYWLAFGLRFDFKIPELDRRIFAVTLLAVLPAKLCIYYALGNCHGWWRYVTFSDLAALLRAAVLSLVTLAAIDYFMINTLHIPRLVLLLDFMLSVFILGGLRAFWRLSREEIRALFHLGDARRVMIVGANHSGESLARQLQGSTRLKMQVIGFLDADAKLQGTRLAGIPVVGPPHAAARLALGFGVEEILVLSSSMNGKQLRGLMDECAQVNVQLKVIPDVDNLLSSRMELQPREVDINDLLRRDPVQLHDEPIRRLLADRVVMITGSGGSIGSEICRQLLRFEPRMLLLVERTENNLFLIEQELKHVVTGATIVPCIADINDVPRMRQLFEQFRPQVVFHAAAHKHVPMMEYNPGEAIKNNVRGTQQVADLASEFGASHFVFISTDKAVNPTSIMGVSKQLAERYVHAFSEVSATKFVVVRFGNVLGSAGSVVPIFREQIRKGGPITITHPEIERFFMTIPEASQLVLQAAAMGKGGEIYVLDMGEPVRIVDLARDMIRLSGLNPDDIEIEFTGLRPGEKLYEELYFDDEQMLPTPHPKVFVAYHRTFLLDEVGRDIERLLELVHGSPDELRQHLKSLLPEYAASKAPPPSPLSASAPPMAAQS